MIRKWFYRSKIMGCMRALSIRRYKRLGFSLIEILVAMTILMIIVLIVAGIFQQTGLAWSLGLRRADAQSVTRAVIGAINRDLAMIVDPANFVIGPADSDTSIRENAYTKGHLDASSGKLTGGLDFWILRPANISTSALTDSDIASRELVHVSYSGGGASITRREEVFKAGNDTPSAGTDTRYNLGNGSVSFSRAVSSTYSGFTSFYDEPGIKITVKPHTPVSINDYEIAVGSCGPDGKWGTEDDIRPWVEGEDNK